MPSATTLMYQAPATVSIYLAKALESCEALGIKPDPVILAAFITACAQDFDTAMREVGPHGEG